MTHMDRDLIRPAILALGIALGGFAAGNGFVRAKSAERFVTVKGVSEREARADLAIWPIHLIAADNDLTVASSQLQRSISQVRQFLARNSIDTAGVSLTGFSVTDASTNQYGGDRINTKRFVIKQTIVVRSTTPEVVLAASERVADLVSAGVVFSSGEEYGAKGPTFIFSGLNQLKPEMIAEATARAREGAEQFARDSRSALGGIRQASQGIFSILPRDQVQGISEESQIVKTVRVVSTVEYFLKN